MSISSTTNRVSYTGNSSTTVFSFPYNFFSNSDLVVISRNTSTGVETTKTLTTHYTVTGAGVDGGGSVTMLTAPATGTTLIIYRDTAATQSMTAETDFFDTSSVEDALDRAAQATQRLVSRVDRAVRLTEGHPAGFDPKLPALLVPNAVLAVNSGGTAFEWGPDQDVLTDAADAAAASATAAAASASSASTSAGTATTQASNAANSASAASTSATDASNSASAASTSATNASNSASAASTSASNASTSETNASTSASTASTQATNASNSASAASTSATNASNSASAASTSATNASNSASAAATSASNAATSETNAAASAAAAAGLISDTAYDATSWNGVTTIAPTKNAVRDKIDAMDTTIAALVSDTAYDATSWNGVTGAAPSKNAVRDKIDAMDTTIAALVSDTAYDATSWDGVTTVAPSKNAVRDQIEAAATAAAALVSDTAYDATSWNGVTTIAPSKNAVRDKIESYASDTVAFTNKDYDGGTASNTSRITVPKDTLANITALTRKEGTLLYATDTGKYYRDNGSVLTAVGSGNGAINYITNGDFESDTTGWEARNWQQTVTITIASPGVCTVASTTGFYVGMPISFKTSGALPTGLTASTTYYVSSVASSTTFKVSATLGGSDVNTSGSQSGTHTSFPLVPINNTTVALSGLTFSRSTSSPLVGVGQGSLVQTNSTIIAGQGVAYPFTIDPAFKAQVLQIYFTYNASSTFVASSGATSSDSDLEVGIWDVTNGTLIPVSPKVLTANGTNNFKYTGTFQTASNSASYSLVLYTPTMNANATGWTFLFDNVSVGPQIMVQGSPITDWIAYTPTLGSGFGTATNVSFFYARSGDTLLVKGSFTTGTTAASLGSITLPSGLALDTTKVSIANTTSNPGAQVGNFACPNANYYGPIVTATGTSTTLVYIGDQIANSAKLTPQNINVVIGSTVVTSVNFSVPISGWSSAVNFSNDTDTRVVAARYHIGSAAAMTSGNIINWEVKDIDTHAAVTTGVGAWRFTAPVSGVYSVSGCYYANAGTGLWLYKNGSNYSFLANSITTTYLCPVGVNTLVNLNAGDYIDARINGSATPTNQGSLGDSVGTENWVSIYRLSGPATIAATDTVALTAHLASNYAVGTNAVIKFDTIDFDTHGGYSTSTGLYTVPVSGKYQITSSIANTASGGGWYISVSGVGKSYVGVSGNANTPTGGGGVVKCVAGDTISIFSDATKTVLGSAAPYATSFSIVRVGN